jgi:hypothetical protein
MSDTGLFKRAKFVKHLPAVGMVYSNWGPQIPHLPAVLAAIFSRNELSHGQHCPVECRIDGGEDRCCSGSGFDEE